ncbi:low molecular weight protein-tyrosine-phosphatase [Rheinheimera sp. WS51]|uniref:low molecular weight protein-tyrosine-phosphatase n=1 Tax=Rheinheimera sp. WS51 TaxID=3425886 RepID=UPI003D93147B
MIKKVLFVCLGNICRSPTAHAVMRAKANLAQINIEIDSAGTSGSHRAEAPDSRSVREGEKLGYDFSKIYSRPVVEADFAYYDLILAMDLDNFAVLQKRCPEVHKHKIQLFMQYHPKFATNKEVPDPYYGGARGFSLVLDLIETGCEGLCQFLKQSS